MRFFGERKRLRELAEREAAGESFYTDRFDEAVRYKLTFAFGDACGNAVAFAAGFARELYRRETGKPFLSRPQPGSRGRLPAVLHGVSG